MKLSSYLDAKFLFTDIVADTKEEVIKQMIDKISESDKKFAMVKKDIEKAVMDREEEIPTAIGMGIAIPHARVECYDDVVVAMATLKKPVKSKVATFNNEDDVDIFVLIVAASLKNKVMLKLMSGITKIALRKAHLLDEIRNASNSLDIYHIIKSSDIEIQDRITAEDIMNTDIVPVKTSDTLEEVARRLTIENVTGFPVVDERGNFLGEITERELIEYGMPKYTSLLSDLSFMTVGEPFEEYFKNEKTVTVQELYRRNPISVDRKASIMEIGFLMVTKGNTRIYVVEKGKYYGMIIRSYLIQKVLHI
jgi:PTS system nitrogen regulatory IIA component